ncbi:HAMP domain-containing histidine kinase [Vagococcus sp. BWB3-3]|uniref:histidine kinase n=1 Tax=Vagococcus allomyrinae TaxID=2794353 RepID=A0A940SU22_9ENTE|nr:HAMP domain-containing sensor histidine kinase [Vagococcus allomyrinae]MBP1040890.1 HAMP domain-containing histidine kinase [Vagococcus allomyrinae]
MITLLFCGVCLCLGVFIIEIIGYHQNLNLEIAQHLAEQTVIAENLNHDISVLNQGNEKMLLTVFKFYKETYLTENSQIEIARTKTNSMNQTPLKEDEVNYQILKNEGTPYLYITNLLKGNYRSWTLTYQYDLSSFIWRSNQTRLAYLIGCGGILLTLTIGLFVILRRLTAPLEKLTSMADQLAEGDLGCRADQGSPDEIGRLATSFNNMAQFMQQYISDLQESSRQKEQLVANLSHEIRTPLTAIKGYADYLLIAEVTEVERIEALSFITSESARLQQLSQMMLQSYTIQHTSLDYHRLSLATILKEVDYTLSEKLQQKNVVFDYEKLENIELYGDPTLLKSLFINLIDNGINASEAGGKVWITAEITQTQLCVAVHDNGCGITQNELEKIGQPFFRSDSSRARHTGGAGLGVTLCHKIIEQHLGTLHYHSSEKGTTVTIVFTCC